MDEREALTLLADELSAVGDDAAVVGDHLVTTDMLHERTDFPAGTTRYTAGWRTVGASLSDVAAMGGEATAAVAVYAAPTFREDELRAFLRGAREVSALVGAEYVGGDLDEHDEFTVVSTVVGRADDPVYRSGAAPDEALCVTGTLGRSAAAVRLFGREDGRANELFRFEPRVAAGRALARHATAMMDSSDGLARSLHQLAAASDCGFHVTFDTLPVHDAVTETADEAAGRRMATSYGEDFELVCTMPEDEVATAREACPCQLTRIGQVTDEGVRMDDEPLPDVGWTHGG